jgi:pantothenate kinase
MSDLETNIQAVLDLVASVRSDGARTVVGIAGPPGSGKSTLAAGVVDRLNAGAEGTGQAALVPMDGFHLDNAELDARGLRSVKGAPQTFDAAGFVDLVRRLREMGGDVRFPLFDRAEDRTVPKAGLIRAGTPVAVVEGNYLLLADGAWADLAPLFDVTVMIAPPMEVLEARLFDRWIGYGLPPEEARRRAHGNDLVNARRVLAESRPADLVLSGHAPSPPRAREAPDGGREPGGDA